jgi:hypothetical protein
VWTSVPAFVLAAAAFTVLGTGQVPSKHLNTSAWSQNGRKLHVV